MCWETGERRKHGGEKMTDRKRREREERKRRRRGKGEEGASIKKLSHTKLVLRVTISHTSKEEFCLANMLDLIKMRSRPCKSSNHRWYNTAESGRWDTSAHAGTEEVSGSAFFTSSGKHFVSSSCLLALFSRCLGAGMTCQAFPSFPVRLKWNASKHQRVSNLSGDHDDERNWRQRCAFVCF